MTQKRIAGALMIIGGLFIFASKQGWIKGDYFLLGLGFIFLLAYFFRKRPIGFLIPSCVLIMLGLFDNMKNVIFTYISMEVEGSLFFFFMSMAFYAMFLIHNFRNPNLKKIMVWPAIVGTAIAAFAIFVFAESNWDISAWMFNFSRFWPLLLIAAGIWLLLTKEKKNDDS